MERLIPSALRVVPAPDAILALSEMTTPAGSRALVTVFVVDGHPVFREGIRRVLETAGGFVVVGQAGRVADGIRGIAAVSPHLALVDISLPDGDGVDLLRIVRNEHPSTRCIVLTTVPDETTFYRSAVAGAAGYLVKSTSPERLVDTCCKVAAGRLLLDSETIDGLRSSTTTAVLDGDRHLAQLSAQERRILGMVTQGLTNREIAAQLSLAEKTVRNYVSNMLGKLGMRNRTQAAAYVARTAASRAYAESVTVSN